MNKNLYTFVKTYYNVTYPEILLFKGENPIPPTKAQQLLGKVALKFPTEKHSLYGTLDHAGIFRIPLNEDNVIPDTLPGGVLVTLKATQELNAIYNKCPLLSRLASGCASCKTCEHLNIPTKEIKLAAPETQRLFKRSILDFDYVAPKTLCGSSDFEPTAEHDILYSLNNPDYTAIQARKIEYAERGKEGAKTRKYVREECTKCCLSNGCTMAHNYNIPCNKQGHFSDETAIITQFYPDILNISAHQRAIIATLAYAGGTHVKVRKSSRHRICGYVPTCQLHDLLKFPDDTLIPTMRDYYPFEKGKISWKRLKEIIPQNPPDITNVDLALMKILKQRYHLGQPMRILGHTNFYLGITWNGPGTLKIITANSNYTWESPIGNFTEFYRALNHI